MADIEVFTAQQVMKILQITEPTLYKLIKKNGLPCFHMGKSLRFQKDKLIAWMDSLERKLSGGVA
jgi:excisionase family DNA binding protein